MTKQSGEGVCWSMALAKVPLGSGPHVPPTMSHFDPLASHIRDIVLYCIVLYLQPVLNLISGI